MRQLPAAENATERTAYPTSAAEGACQVNGMAADKGTNPTAAYQASIVSVRSPSIRRVEITANDHATAEASGSRAASWNASVPGRATIMTPRNPATVAAQRCRPTVSPSSGIDSAVMKRGEAKLMAVLSATGR